MAHEVVTISITAALNLPKTMAAPLSVHGAVQSEAL